MAFQSTPSVWRETLPACCNRRQRYFNPLPPCGGRQRHLSAAPERLISIHSLRVEGDS